MMLVSLFLNFLLFAATSANSHNLLIQNSLKKFDRWFEQYTEGKIVFPASESEKNSLPSTRGLSLETLGPGSQLDKLLQSLRENGSQQAAKKLLKLIAFRFAEDPHKERHEFALQKPWAVRAQALTALENFEKLETMHWLASHVANNSSEYSLAERKAAVIALGNSKHREALLGVLSALYDESWQIRAAAAEAAGNLGGVEATQAIAVRLQDEEAYVRARCLEALGKTYQIENAKFTSNERIFSSIANCLQDSDWRVRLAAAEFFRNHPHPLAVDYLIPALKSEEEKLIKESGRKRVLYGFMETLQSITGLEFSFNSAEQWQEWWQAQQKDFVLSSNEIEPKPPSGVPYYFGIPVRTDNMVFILDTSGSMREFCEPILLSGVTAPISFPADQQLTKLDWAKLGLVSTLQQLKPTDRFNVIFFETAVIPLFEGTEPATKKNIKEAIKRIQKTNYGGGSTNVFGALELGLEISNLDKVDPFQTDADTIFLLSDGEPSAGLILDTSVICETITAANRSSRIALNTIYFGGEESSALTFMRKLATQNYGQFRHALTK